MRSRRSAAVLCLSLALPGCVRYLGSGSPQRIDAPTDGQAEAGDAARVERSRLDRTGERTLDQKVCVPSCQGKCAGAEDGCGGYCNSSNTCNGCCDQQGVCQPGTHLGACGHGGTACVGCTAGQVCTSGACCTPSCAAKCPGEADGCGGTCQSNTCAGCCLSGKCTPGVIDTACGKGGVACLNCAASGGACSPAQTCVGGCSGCTGCCLSGSCTPGNTDSACGKGGAVCTDCTALVAACINHECVAY